MSPADDSPVHQAATGAAREAWTTPPNDWLWMALAAARMGTWELEASSGRLRWSDNLEAVLGIAPGGLSGTLDSFVRLVAEEDRAVVSQAVRRALQKERDCSVEFRIVQPDRSVRWIESHGRSVVGADGQVERVVGVCMDISDRKRADQARSRLASIVESSDDAVIGKTLEGTITDWNEAASRLYGYTREEAIGRHISMLLPPEGQAELASIMERLRRGERVESYDTVRVRKDGSPIHVSVAVSPMRDRAGRLTGASAVARDITGAMRARAELQRKEQQFEALADSASDAIAQFDRDLRFTFVNAAMARRTGRRREEFAGKTNEELALPPDAEQRRTWIGVLRHVFDTGEETAISLTAGRPGGPTTHYQVRVAPELTSAGKVDTVLAISREVTELVETGRVAEERSRLLDTTLRSIGDAVVATDEGCRIRFANPAAARLTGWSAAEVAGRPCDEVVALRDHVSGRPIESPVHRVLREGTPAAVPVQALLLTRDGASVPVDAVSTPIVDERGAVHGAVLVFRDVAEQRRADETRNRLASIVESSDDAIVSKDLNGIVTSWNKAAERLYGYSAEEMVGQSKSIVIPLDMPEELPTILRRIRAGERIEHYDTSRIRKDGRRIELSISVSPIRDAGGNVVGASTIARDISDRRRAEEGERDRARLSALGAEIGRALIQPVPLADMLAACCEALLQRLDGALARIWIADDGNGVLDLAASAGIVPPGAETYRQVRIDGSLVGLAARDRTCVSVDAFADDPRVREPEWARREGIRGFCCCPLLVEGRLVGAMALFARHPMAQAEIDSIASLADEIAVGIERRRAEEDLRRRQTEIEALNERLRRAMQETHHRVRNNLQLISALIDMQAAERREAVPLEEFKRVADQVRALAAVHDMLTQQARAGGEASHFSARDMLEVLLTLLRGANPAGRIEADIQDATLTIKQGTALAVVANELVTNALKYGGGHVRLRLSVEDRTVTLEVADDGPGFPAHGTPRRPGSAGLELIEHVTAWDLGGQVAYGTSPTGGGLVSVRFPLVDGQGP